MAGSESRIANEKLDDYSEFNPSDYLHDYYNHIGKENLTMMKFFAAQMSDVSPESIMLDYGCGPTIYQIISAADTVKEIHLGDYLNSNLTEIQKWLDNDPDSFDWSEYINAALNLEGRQSITAKTIAERAEKIRQRITRLLHCDVNAPETSDIVDRYDVVMSNFCIECVSTKKDDWLRYFDTLVSLLKPGGKLIMASTKEANLYVSGDKKFPVVYLTDADLIQNLKKTGFNPDTICIEHVAADKPTRSYKGFMLISAIRSKI